MDDIRAIAIIVLVILQILVGLGNWWFTFGIWPINWGSFILFGICNIVISAFFAKVMKGED